MSVEEFVDRLRGGPDPDRWSAALDRIAELTRHRWGPNWGSVPPRDWGVRLGALISYSMAVTGGPPPSEQSPLLLGTRWAEHGVDGIAYALAGAGHRIDGTTTSAEREAAALGPAAIWRAGWHVREALPAHDELFDAYEGPYLTIGEHWLERTLALYPAQSQ